MRIKFYAPYFSKFVNSCPRQVFVFSAINLSLCMLCSFGPVF